VLLQHEEFAPILRLYAFPKVPPTSLLRGNASTGAANRQEPETNRFLILKKISFIGA